MIGSKRGLLFSSLLVAVSLYGCSSASMPASFVRSVPRDAIAHTAANKVIFILDPGTGTTAAARDVARVSISFPGNRRPAHIAVSGGACTACSAKLNVPGNVPFFTFDTLDSAGKRLSHTTFPRAFYNGSIVDLTLASSVSSIGISGFDNDRPAYGKKAVVSLYVWARNTGSNALIVGPGAYDPPIALTQSTELRGMRLSKTEVRSGADALPTLVYPGGLQSAMVSARSGHSTASALVMPRVPVTNLPLPSSPKPELSAAGNYVWTAFGSSVERLDIVTGKKRVTQLAAANQQPGALTAVADGSLWYAGCRGVPGAPGVGRVTAAGATAFFPTETAPVYDCPNFAIASDGALWFTGGMDLTRMSAAGVFTTIAVKPHPTAKSELAGLVFGNDDTMWAVSAYPNNAGSLAHVSQSGAVLGRFGNKTFISVATDGRERLYAIGWYAISSFDLTGKLLATYAGVGGRATAQTVSPDGTLWFVEGPDAYERYAVVVRIAKNGAMSEFAVPADASAISAIASAGDGSVWFLGSDAAKLSRIEL